MNALGLIVEYNPFHNGHLYHLERSREISGADGVICVMSGNFIQRGEPGVVNKWARARAALYSGADLVLELPAVYSLASAESFACGGVAILNATGVVASMCFGSESGKLEELDMIADVLYREPEEYREELRAWLDRGFSFPRAREEALKSYLKQKAGRQVPLQDILNQSNNILALEYLKALKRFNSGIKPLTIKRIANAYNSQEFTGGISSATAVRKALQSWKTALSLHQIEAVVPPASLEVLREEFSEGRGPVFLGDFEQLILAALRRIPAENLREVPDVSEGLEHRLKKAAENSGTLEELIGSVSTRRYTRTRIQRILLSLLNGITKKDLDLFRSTGGPQYIRVLGFNRKGQELLAEIKEKSSIPIITKTADYKNSPNLSLARMLEIEAATTDIYVLAYPNPAHRKAGQEFTQNPVRV